MNESQAELDVSVVIPVFNEQDSVKPLLQALHESLSKLGRSYEILLVDDGSADGTWDRLVEGSKRVPHIRLIRLRRNFGQTAAMSAGFDHARGRVIVTLDADLQNDPADIGRLLACVDAGADVVSGWRKDRHDKLITRRLPSVLANALISRITGVRLHDYGCTLKAYRREVLQGVRLYGEMHRFIPALASWVGARLEEVEVRHHPRRYGQSKYGLSRTSRVILDLITVKFILHYSRGPIQIFGRIGGALGLTGAFMLMLMVATNLSFRLFGTALGANLIKRPFWIMTSFMLVFFGLQFISMGLLAEMQIRTYHESQNKPIYVVRETIESPERGAAA
jgi:glycosyltransferase involved in cell wall biosynthesis